MFFVSRNGCSYEAKARHWLPVLVLGLLLGASALSAAPEPVEPSAKGTSTAPVAPPPLSGRSGLYLGAGLLSGTHSPELEPRFQNDRLGGSLLLGGFATNTDWENTGAFGVPLHARYHVGQWQFGFEYESVTSRPTYQGFLSFTSGTTTIRALDSTEYQPLSRTNLEIFAGYLLNPGSNVPVSLLLGLRQFSLEGDYALTRLSQITLATGTFNQLESTTQGEVAGDAFGFALGVETLLPLADKLRLELRFKVFSGTGDWQHTYLLAKANSGGGSAEYSTENGNYSYSATRFEVGANYEIVTNGSLYVRLIVENGTSQDSEVIVLKASTVTTENTLSTRLTEFLLTYPGSAQKDKLSGVEIGYEARLDL